MKKKIEFLIRLIPVFSIMCLISAFHHRSRYRGEGHRIAAGIAATGLLGGFVYFVLGFLFRPVEPKF